MKKCYLFCVLFFSITGLELYAQSNIKKVLIIGIDGCRPDAVRHANTPNIDELWQEGAYTFKAQTDPISFSGICWTSMLTGVWHDKHKVLTNAYKKPNVEAYPHFFRRLKEANSRLQTYTYSNWSPIHKILQKDDADIAESYSPDDQITNHVIEALKTKNLDVVFVQFDDVDHAGHAHDYSTKSQLYVKAVEKSDSLLGMIVSAVKERETYQQEDWLIIVTTDHGGSNFTHGKDIPEHTTIFFIANGKSVGKGEIMEPVGVVDVAATALYHMGIKINPKWNLDGEPRVIREQQAQLNID